MIYILLNDLQYINHLLNYNKNFILSEFENSFIYI